MTAPVAGGVLSLVLADIEWLRLNSHIWRNVTPDDVREAIRTVEAMAALPAKWRADYTDSANPENSWDQGFAYGRGACAIELTAAYRGEAATQDDLTPGGTVEQVSDDDLPGMWSNSDFTGGAPDASQSAPSGGGGELPELPEPLKEVVIAGDHDAGLRTPLEELFTAEQMLAIRDAGIEHGRRLATAGQGVE